MRKTTNKDFFTRDFLLQTRKAMNHEKAKDQPESEIHKPFRFITTYIVLWHYVPKKEPCGWCCVCE